MKRWIFLIAVLCLASCQRNGVQARGNPPSFDPNDSQVRSVNCQDGQAEFLPGKGLTVAYGPKAQVQTYKAGQKVPVAPGEKDVTVPASHEGILIIPPPDFVVGLAATYPDVGPASMHATDRVTGRSVIFYPGSFKSVTICLMSLEHARKYGYEPMATPTSGAKA